jgi:L-fucose mutarotase
MLKGIDPLLNADILYVLQSMGHGDDVVICDANFPADAVAAESVHGELLLMTGAVAPRAARAILSVLPLDQFVDKPVWRMEVIGKPEEILPVVREVQKEVDAAEGKHRPIGSIERFAFYETAKKAYAVILTGERRFYGNFILKKGVVPPDGG